MERPRDISGFRSRAINAGYAWTDANRPVAGEGVAVSDAAGGRVVSLAPGARLPRPRPWDAVADLMDGELGVRLYTAPVVGPGGAPLPYDPDAEGFSDLAKLPAEPDADGPGGAPRLAIAPGDVADGWVLAEANADLTAWRLALDPERAGADGAVPVADLRVEDGVLSAARALHSGAVVFAGSSSDHWGETEPLDEIPGDDAGSWNASKDEEEATAVAKSYLVDVDLDSDGKVVAKWYRTDTIDTKGNVVSVSERAPGAVPDPGEASEETDDPPCGNPLNDDDSDAHPLDVEEGPGWDYDGGGGDKGDHHPLDEEGYGGFTPKCGDNAESGGDQTEGNNAESNQAEGENANGNGTET